MTAQPQYQDGQIVNGWRFVAATNSWVRATQAGQPVTLYTGQNSLTPAKPTPWGKIIGLSVAGFFGLIFLIGVIGALASGGTSTPVPVATQAAPVQPAPVEPVPNYPAPEPEPQIDERALALGLLEGTWNKQSYTDQQAICDGWNLGYDFQETILDQFESVIEDIPVTRSDIRQFFNSKCS